MLNKVKIISFDLWDDETGEADIIVEFENGKTIKGFTIEHFEKDKFANVTLSLFAKNYEIGENFTSEITNINDKYETKVQGKIINHVVSEETGEYIIVDSGNIFVTVFDNFNRNGALINKFFSGNGRLDIEINSEEW